MNAEEKINTYEVYIEDMLRVFQERFNELDANYKNLSEYEQGRWMAYYEILDIIRTRKDLIAEMLADQ